MKNQSIQVGISTRSSILLKMPQVYRRYMLPEEKSMIRKDLIKITKKEEENQRGRSKKVRLYIEDIKDGETYKSEPFYEDGLQSSGSVLLVKSGNRFTLALTDSKLECLKLEPKEVINQKVLQMDYKLDARRKQNDLEGFVQEKTRKVQNLPILQIQGLKQQLQNDENSDSNNVRMGKKSKKQLKLKKNQHRVQFSSDSDDDQKPKKKQKKIEEIENNDISEDSMADRISQDSNSNY